MKAFMVWLLKALVLAITIFALIYLRTMLQASRVDLYQAQAELEAKPQIQAQAASLKIDLEKNDVALKKVQALIPTKDQLNVFIDELSRQAQGLGVNMTVPTVEEKVVLDDRGSSVPATGPVVDIHLHVVGSGDADALVQFLHSLETSPYIVELDSFRLETASTRTLPGSFAAPQIPTDRPVQANLNSGYLEADITIAVANTNWVKPK